MDDEESLEMKGKGNHLHKKMSESYSYCDSGEILSSRFIDSLFLLYRQKTRGKEGNQSLEEDCFIASLVMVKSAQDDDDDEEEEEEVKRR